MTGPDDLLLLLVQHWARDKSIFPTEDDRLDLPTIMLFQSYTGCRPAELVHAPRGRGLQDPLDEEDTHDAKLRPDTEEAAYDDESGYGDDNDNDDSGYTSATEGNSQDTADDVVDYGTATSSETATTTTTSSMTLTVRITRRPRILRLLHE